MREIKFRAWDGKRIMKGFWVGSEFGEVFLCENIAPIIIKKDKDDVILMQYTGLKDKNGKEIYENDILKLYDKTIGEVIFHFPDGRRWFLGI